MTPYQAYRCYMATKFHFQTGYDMFKYRGGLKNATKEIFEKRKDKYRFATLAEKYDDTEVLNLFVANFSEKADYEGLFDDQTEPRYKRWKARRQSLSYTYKSEIKKLFEDAKESDLCYNDVFFSSESQHPPVLQAFLGKTISLDAFVILDRINNFTDELVCDVLTEDVLRVMKKYSPFLKVDLDVYRSITQQVRDDVFG